MHLERVDNLTPGLIVARPLYDDMGQVLLHAGVTLIPRYIETLRQKGFTQIYVKDPDSPLDVEPEEDITPETRAKAVRLLKDAFRAIEGIREQMKRKASAEDLSAACASATVRSLLGHDGPVGRVRDVVGQLLDEILTRATLAGLVSIKGADTQLYEHSLDVCVVAVMIGRAAGMTNIRLTQLATGCLLHDIGKVFVEPHADREKSIRQHTHLGFELLRNSPQPDIMAPHVAFEHHEHQDGTGLPRRLVGSNTIARNRDAEGPVPTLIGEIAAVANAYDNLSTGVHGQDPITPDQAIGEICKAAGARFNREVVNAFLRVVPVFPKGMELLVRTAPYKNYTAIVTEVNPNRLDRPTIGIIRTNRGRPIKPIMINLAEEEEIEIRAKMVLR